MVVPNHIYPLCLFYLYSQFYFLIFKKFYIWFLFNGINQTTIQLRHFLMMISKKILQICPQRNCDGSTIIERLAWEAYHYVPLMSIFSVDSSDFTIVKYSAEEKLSNQWKYWFTKWYKWYKHVADIKGDVDCEATTRTTANVFEIVQKDSPVQKTNGKRKYVDLIWPLKVDI